MTKSLDELFGSIPDMTGGMDSVAYVRQGRGGVVPAPVDIRGVYRDKDGGWFAENPATLERCHLTLSPEQMMALNATVGGEWDEELDRLARAYELAWRRKVADRLLGPA